MHWTEKRKRYEHSLLYDASSAYTNTSMSILFMHAESETENTQHQSVLNPNYPWYSLISVVMISVSLSLVYVITGCGDQAGSVAMCPDNVCCDQDMMSRDQLTQLQMLHPIRDVSNK